MHPVFILDALNSQSFNASRREEHEEELALLAVMSHVFKHCFALCFRNRKRSESKKKKLRKNLKQKRYETGRHNDTISLHSQNQSWKHAVKM